MAGQVSYEVHSTRDAGGSPSRLARVSEYLREKVNESFEGDWMLIGEWRDVPPMNNPGSSTEVGIFQKLFVCIAIATGICGDHTLRCSPIADTLSLGVWQINA